MKSNVPHDILTISELTRRKNRISSETIPVEDLILTEDTVQKLRASSSMFNKSVYIQLLHDGKRYNVEHLTKSGSKYRLSLISHSSLAVFVGEAGGSLALESVSSF